MQPTAINSDTLQSQVIDLLRFPLIIGVVFIHNASSTLSIHGVEFGSSASLPMHYACSQLFSQVLGRVAVPLFFLISGFLFFLNVDFSKRTYVNKLRTRAKTLLIPYLFWNLSAVVLRFVVYCIPSLDALVNNSFEFTPHYLLQALWGEVADGKATMPVAYPFWFIRDLMVLVVLTPLVYTYVKKLGVYGILLLSVLWLFDWWFLLPGLSIVAVFFFTLGAWISISRRNLVLEAEKVKYLVFALYPVFVLIDLLTKESAANPFIHNAGILCGILFWLNLGASSIRTMVITITKYQAVKSASVLGFSHINTNLLAGFMSHGSWTANTKNAAAERNLLGRITIVLIGLGTYYLLKKFTPAFTNFITGGR
jgi:surface polysaccharide O-acyltransferase-like enzyme